MPDEKGGDGIASGRGGGDGTAAGGGNEDSLARLKSGGSDNSGFSEHKSKEGGKGERVRREEEVEVGNKKKGFFGGFRFGKKEKAESNEVVIARAPCFLVISHSHKQTLSFLSRSRLTHTLSLPDEVKRTHTLSPHALSLFDLVYLQDGFLTSAHRMEKWKTVSRQQGKTRTRWRTRLTVRTKKRMGRQQAAKN